MDGSATAVYNERTGRGFVCGARSPQRTGFRAAAASSSWRRALPRRPSELDVAAFELVDARPDPVRDRARLPLLEVDVDDRLMRLGQEHVVLHPVRLLLEGHARPADPLD